ncbi:MAG: topology modulation protein [Actinobacteria bacterium]|nr:topology modulation protein [Actinomycetota bacterium]
MRRVAVLGCSGSGKTVLANRLGETLGLPIVHGDFHRKDWEEIQPAVIALEEWVIDAMRLDSLDERLARADTAVFLDLSSWECFLGVLRRRRRYRGRLHADGVADFVNLELLFWLLRFRRRHRPRVLELLERHAGSTEIVVLRSRAEATAFATSCSFNTSLSRAA